MKRHRKKALDNYLDGTYSSLEQYCKENDLFKLEEAGADCHAVGQVCSHVVREEEEITIVLSTKNLLKNLVRSQLSTEGALLFVLRFVFCIYVLLAFSFSPMLG